jgi:hypothetical protein
LQENILKKIRRKIKMEIDKKFTMKQAHKYLEKHGVEWSYGWFKTQVGLGKIPSEKILNSRAVTKVALDEAIREHREKMSAA